jgi:gluconokinase
MHSMMPADQHINPLGNLQLWNDNRSADAAIALTRSEIGKKIYASTGTPIHPMSPLTKIIHLKTSDPGLFRSASYFIGIKEYLLYRFTGQLVLDYSTASATGMFDSANKRWFSPALEQAGIVERQLARLAAQGETFTCNLGGILRGVPVVPGLSDGCAANLGAACLEMKTDPEGVLFSYCLGSRDYVTGGASNNCYNVIDRLASDLKVPMEVLNDETLLREGSGSDLVFLPWMYGERAPVQLFTPVTGFVNRKPGHTAAQLMKCAVEGILFNLKHIAQKLEILNGGNFSEIHLSGGFSQLKVVRNLTSRIFNLPMLEHRTGESSALGTAFYTACETGIVNDRSEIRKWNPVVEVHTCNADYAEDYAQAYLRFRTSSRDHLNK